MARPTHNNITIHYKPSAPNYLEAHANMDKLRKCHEIIEALSKSIEGLKSNTSTIGSNGFEVDKDPKNKLNKLLLSLVQHNIQVHCEYCGNQGVEGSARAYLSLDRSLKIVLCANRLREGDIEEALTHEAVHAHDFLNQTCDMHTPEGLAYTEIRAAREAECAGKLSMFRNSCIKEKAAKATRNVFPDADTSVIVDQVFKQAMSDNTPWS